MNTSGTHDDHVVSTVIIGGGQAGLATAHALLSRGQDCVVLERNDRLGDNWRHHYDSLRLYTPARYDGLPGVPFPGEPWAYPTKDDVADYLQTYAAQLGLPVRLGVRVQRLARGTAAGEDTEGGFVVETTAGTYHCDNVVVATGTFGRRPHLPDFAADLDPAILQLHSSEYRRPSQLSPGPVLVVGASHSGCDIALELAETRPTTLVGRDCGQLPLRWDTPLLRAALPAVLFAWRHVLTRRTPMGRRTMPHVRQHGGPMLRVQRQDLAARGVVRNVSRVEGVRNGLPLLTDGTVVTATNIVWATGFEQHFDWIDLPVIDEDGWPREYRGVADDVPGLFFCGLSFQYSFSSMVLPGVGRDADYVAGRIVARTRDRAERATALVRA
ncbi:portal protein [Intrasporangium chromatireducens Q5-1]|uniref:Portal protein n=1 Tax=Intrasporangium chromatireducens Q5-1 TaxID=584657 RepID=W9GJB2_9MICO|nr:NAD(P)/FAD-dependent oxidoreductase [Intrasporangium chromatireducens]EWT05232.1 portal protein [Intrasporangium chromatireducens Q5-1]